MQLSILFCNFFKHELIVKNGQECHNAMFVRHSCHVHSGLLLNIHCVIYYILCLEKFELTASLK